MSPNTPTATTSTDTTTNPSRRRLRDALGACLVALAVLGSVVATPAAAAPNGIHSGQLVSSTDAATWTPHVLDGFVGAIAEVGDTVLVGGKFNQIATAAAPDTPINRPNLFSFQKFSGTLNTGFSPAINGEVTSILPTGDGRTVWVAGGFNSLNNQTSRNLVKIDVTTGQRVTEFAPPALNGQINDLQLRNGKLYLSGRFTMAGTQPRLLLAAVDPVTGALDPDVRADFALPRRNSFLTIASSDISPDGTKMIVTGNFTQVNGLDRYQIAMFDLTTSPVSVANWHTARFGPTCGSIWPTYMRDIDFSPDGSFFVVVTTGGYAAPGGALCDAAARWETGATGSNLQPTWVDLSGGDTLTAVAVTDTAVYIGGHQRWSNNPFAADRVGPGAVTREGLVALDPRNGATLSWNPGRTRRVAVYDMVATSTGLWVGSDSDRIAGFQQRRRLAFLALDPTTSMKAEFTGELPGQVVSLGTMHAGATTSSNRVTTRSFTGTAVTASNSVGESGTAPSGLTATSLRSSVLAGSGAGGFADGTGTAARFNNPGGFAWDAQGNLFVADVNTHRIRRITPAGVVTTFAGSGAAGAVDGTGTAATFRNPYGLAFDSAGNLFVADGGNHRIRRITPTGVVTTFAGSSAGFADGTGTAASFNLPLHLTFDAAGDLFVSDYTNNRIRRITPTGVVTTFAGSSAGFLDGTGTAAQFRQPWGTVFDTDGNLLVADRSNHRIRRITPTGVVTTFAGSGAASSIDGTGTAATFSQPLGLVFDPAGNLFVTDYGTHRVRRVTPAAVVTTYAGSGAAGAATGPANGSVMSGPVGLTRDAEGTLYISEWTGHRISRIHSAGPGSLDLSWVAPTETGGAAITDYRIEYRTSPDGDGTVADDGVSTATTARLTGLTDGTAYDVRISAVTATGTGPASGQVTATPSAPVGPVDAGTPGDWSGLRGAFMVDGKLFTGWSNGTFRVQDYDGSTFGPRTNVPLALVEGNAASLNRFATEDLPTVTGMFYDRVTGRLYFTRSNSTSLHHRTFSPESRIVGGERFASAANAGGVTWSNVRTMFLASGKLYTSDAAGNLVARDWNSATGVPSGTPTTVSGPAVDGHDWRAADTFVYARAGVEVPNAAPQAAFTVSCTQGTCRVNGAGSSDPDGAVASHAWDFGDGSGTGAGTTAHHVYAASGTYTITLTVTDHRGATATATRTVQVLLDNVAPVASFRPACDGLDCTFDTAGTGDADGSITGWSWDFGDGTTSTSPSPEHRYVSAGTRAVSLTVTDDRGATSTMSTNLAVVDPQVRPEARFRAASGTVANSTSATVRVPSAVRAGDVMVLVATSSSHSAPLAAPAGWTLLSSGNNATATAGTAAWTRTATAADAGANVRVTTTATSKMTLQVAAYSGAAGVSAHRVAFDTVSRATRTTPTVDVATAGSAVLSVWSDKSNDNTGWDLPAGTTLRHEAVGTGTGHMTTALAETAPVDEGVAGALTAVADSANRRGLVWSIVIAPDTTPPNLLPIATFSTNCSGLACTFDASASTDPDGTIAATSWSIGGTSHTGPTASRTFPAAGTHPVTVTVTDALGATNSATRSVTVAVPAPGVARFRAATGANVNAALATVTVPGPVTAGDRMLLLSTTNGAGAVPTAPTGWTLVESTSNAATDTTSALWTKVAEAADAGSTVTVTTGAMAKASLHLVAYADAGTITARALSFHTTNRSARTTPMLLAATPGSTLVSYWADKSSDTTTWDVPSTAQLRHLSEGSGAGHITSALADSVSLSAGTTGGLTATADSSTVRGITWSIVIAPAPIAGIAPAAPTGLALSPANSQLAATWTAPTANGGTAVIDYVVEYRTSPAGAWTVFPDGMSTATSATITGLTNGTAHDVRISAVNSAGTSAPSRTATATVAPWTPAALRANVAVWLDAAEASTITLNGDTVSRWNDRSGNSRHLTQATATQQPLLVTGGLNGRDVLTFDGADDILNRTTTGAAGLTTSSIISVFRLNSGGSSEDIPMGIGSTGQTGRMRGLYRAANSTTLGFAGWANDVPSSSLGYDVAGGGYHLFGFVQSAPSGPGNVTLLRNGTTEARATNSTLNTTLDGFSVGSLQGSSVGNYHTAMSVGEVLVFHTAIDTATRQRVEGYLAHKWGLSANLPADHPYSTTPP